MTLNFSSSVRNFSNAPMFQCASRHQRHSKTNESSQNFDESRNIDISKVNLFCASSSLSKKRQNLYTFLRNIEQRVPKSTF